MKRSLVSSSVRWSWFFALFCGLLGAPQAIGQDGSYCFEERSGFFTAGGAGPDAELVNMDPVSAWVPSTADGGGTSALRFDGDDDVVVLGREDDFDFSGAGFTWSVWAQPLDPEGDGNGTFFATGEPDTEFEGMITFFGFFAADEQFINFDLFGIGGIGEFHPTGFLDGLFHHVAVTCEYDTDGENDTVSIYFDGELLIEESELDVQIALTGSGSLQGDLMLGQPSLVEEEFQPFEGTLDNAQVYSVPLTAEQILDLATMPGLDCPVNPLECPAEGDTTCAGIAVEGTANGEAGTWTLTVDATDTSGDDIIYTALASEVNDAHDPVEVTQAGDPAIEIRLRAGSWVIEVEVDDTAFCDDPTASCSTEQIDVDPVTGELLAQWCFEGRGGLVSDEVSGFDGEVFLFDEETETLVLDEEFADNYVPGVSSTSAFRGAGENVIVIPESADVLNTSENFTIAAWVKTSQADAGAIFAQLPAEETEGGAKVFFIAGGVLAFDVGDVDVVESEEEISDGEWHHVAVVVERDIDGPNEGVTYYVDGNPGDTLTDMDFNAFGDDPLEFPTTLAGGSFFFPFAQSRFQGSLDTIQFWNFPLSDTEISEAMSTGGEVCPAGDPIDCTGTGQVPCPTLAVEGPDSGIEGTYTLVAGDIDEVAAANLWFTFSGEGPEGQTFEELVYGETEVTRRFAAGPWTFRVDVDDTLFCENPPDDCNATAAQTFEPRPETLLFATCFEDFDPDAINFDTVSGVEYEVVAFPDEEGNLPEAVDGIVSPTALFFDGVDSALIVDEPGPIDAGLDFTIACWIQVGDDPESGEPDAFAGSIALLGSELDQSGDAPGAISWFVFEGRPMAHVLFCCGDDGQFLDDEIGFVADGEPHHVALTVDVDFEDVEDLDILRIYVDGELAGEIEDDLQAEGAPVVWPLHVGYSTFDWPSADFEAESGRDLNHFNGIIDDFKFWSFALDEDEIVDQFNDNTQAGCAGGTAFQRGNPNGDGAIDLSDPVFVLNWLFLGGTEPTCLDSADINDDGTNDLTDGVYSLNSQFSGGPPPHHRLSQPAAPTPRMTPSVASPLVPAPEIFPGLRAGGACP